MNNLNIGVVINAMLTASEALTMVVGTKIFPLVAKYDTKFPFITYQRTGITTQYVKDGLVSERVSATIYVAANSYSESIEIANMVRDAMELKCGVYGGTYVRQVYLSGSSETFYDGIYIQQLTFNITI